MAKSLSYFRGACFYVAADTLGAAVIAPHLPALLRSFGRRHADPHDAVDGGDGECAYPVQPGFVSQNQAKYRKHGKSNAEYDWIDVEIGTQSAAHARHFGVRRVAVEFLDFFV